MKVTFGKKDYPNGGSGDPPSKVTIPPRNSVILSMATCPNSGEVEALEPLADAGVQHILGILLAAFCMREASQRLSLDSVQTTYQLNTDRWGKGSQIHVQFVDLGIVLHTVALEAFLSHLEVGLDESIQRKNHSFHWAYYSSLESRRFPSRAASN